MLGNYNGGSFQCYFSKDESLDAIFLNSDSFNGIDPIFPIQIYAISAENKASNLI
jgi:hypothetical protein